MLNAKGEERGWPAYLLRGRLRTSTAAMIIAFLGLWWVYATYQPPAQIPQVPASEVVPPGFVPDPQYTWVPRTYVRERPTETPTTTEMTSPTETTTTSPGETTPSTPTSPGATATTGPSTPGPSTTAPSTSALPSSAPAPTTPLQPPR